MIQVIFRLGGEQIIVEIRGNEIMFCELGSGGRLAPLEGLKLSKSGVIKENPDLEDDPNWRVEALRRFKDFFKNIETENEKVEYVIEELEKYGYEAIIKRKNGFRPIKLK